MDLFTKLFGNFIAFVYHCFDRIVIHGYLSALSRPEIAPIFGTRLHRRHRGKLATVIDQIEYGHHVFRAYDRPVRAAPTSKNAFLKQYEKFSTLLRNELCSNKLTVGKGWTISRGGPPDVPNHHRAGFQTQWLNVHVDFTNHHRRGPLSRHQNPRSSRHPPLGGPFAWRPSARRVDAKQIHQAILTTFRLSDRNYGLDQLRYSASSRGMD